jgi:3-oxoacyl-[acyl-carrier-protein] synthase-3
VAVDTIRLVSTGMWVPERVLTNADLERMVETTNEWIVERTGIHERRIAADDVGVVDMGCFAAQNALADAGLGPDDVDAIIVSTATPDRLLPATACDIQAKLGSHRAVSFDVWGACSGWLYALNVARGLIATGQVESALCIATEKMSSITDWTDRATCVLFGDAAGAAVVRRSEEEGQGIIASYMRSDGSLAELLYRAPYNQQPKPAEIAARNGFLQMAGREIFKNAVRSMCEAVDAVLDQAGVSKGEVDLLVPHQANIRIIEATAKYARVPMDRVWVNVDRYGNTSSATIPVSLHEAREAGRIAEGSLVLIVTFGAGLTWAGTLIRW